MNPTEVLRRRGIEAAARNAGWEDGNNPYGKPTPGWLYPVFSFTGSPVPNLIRWKAADSKATPKYVWHPEGTKDRRPKYYLLPGAVEAIAQAGGELHFVSGEPDLLTMVSAGLHNVMCAFGEGAVDEMLSEDLDFIGVDRVIYWRDFDQAGFDSAVKVRGLLADTPIGFECRLTPGAHEEGYDLNKLWTECQFDVGVFWANLSDSILEELPISEPEPAPRPQRAAPPSDLAALVYERWCEDVERTAIAAWNLQGPDRQGFSKMIPCPFHQEKTASAHWNYQTHGMKCFGACGKEYNTQECAEQLGCESWEDYRNRIMPAPQRSIVRTSVPRNNGKSSRVVLTSRREAARKAKALLLGQEIPQVEPYLSPYFPLRQFGGLAKLWEPGQVGLIISGAGMGKTSFLERCIDNLNVEGRDAILWGPEWSAERYQNRAVSRYMGPSMELQIEHESHEFEKAHHVTDISSRKLSQTDIEKAVDVLERIERWPGETHYLDPTLPLRKALKLAGDEVERLRDEGRRLALGAFDYAQLTLNAGSGWAELESMIAFVQEWAIRYQVFALVLSQVNKGEANRLRTTGKPFTADAAQLLSDQRAKLVLTLNPVYINKERHEKAWIVCVKNSIGTVPAKLLVETAFYRHDWTDNVLEGLSYDMSRPKQQAQLQSDDETPPLEDEIEWWSY